MIILLLLVLNFVYLIWIKTKSGFYLSPSFIFKNTYSRSIIFNSLNPLYFLLMFGLCVEMVSSSVYYDKLR